MWLLYLGIGFALGTLFGIALLALFVASRDSDSDCISDGELYRRA